MIVTGCGDGLIIFVCWNRIRGGRLLTDPDLELAPILSGEAGKSVCPDLTADDYFSRFLGLH
jgi:hypothetical protein